MGKLYIVAKGNQEHVQHSVGVTLKRFQATDVILWQFIEAQPSFPQLESGDIALCMGKSIYVFLAGHGIVPKNKSAASNRMRMIPCMEGHVMFTFDPYEGWNEYAKRVDIMTDTTLALRAQRTGSLKVKYGNYRYVEDYTDIINILYSHQSSGEKMDLSLDLETVGLNEWDPEKWIVSISLTVDEGTADMLYFTKDFQPDRTQPEGSIQKTLWDQINFLVNHPDVKVRGANLKFDCRWMRVKWGMNISRFVFDCILAGSLLDENRSNSLNVLTKIYEPDLGGYDDAFNQKFDKGRMDLVPKEDMLFYGGGDTDACQRVSNKVRQDLLQDPQLSRFYVKVLHPSSRAFEEMETGGVLVDQERYADLRGKLESELERCQKEVNEILPARLKAKHNWDTSLTRSAVITDFLFTPMGLNLKPLELTGKTKAPSSAKSHIMKFMDHPDVKEFMEVYSDFLTAKKTMSTYVDGFLKHLRADGRYHPSYIMHRSDDGGTNCLPADQLVLTDQGYKPIVDVTVGSKVLSHTGHWSEVSDFIHNGDKPVFKVTMSDGRSIRATENHPLFTVNGWVEVGDLAPGDTVIGYSGDENWTQESIAMERASFDFCSVLCVEFWGVEPTYDITVAETHSFVAEGLVVHNTGRLSAKDPAIQCVTGETIVWTPTGLHRIDSLVDGVGFIEKEIDLITESGVEATSYTFKKWADALVRVTLRNGIQFRCTPDHPFRVTTGEMVQAKDLTTGQQVKNQTYLPDFSRETELPTAGYIDRDKIKDLTLPEKMTEDLAWLIGFWLGEGSICKRLGLIVTATSKPMYQNRVASTFESFGLNPGTRPDRVYVYSNAFYRWWTEVLGLGEKSYAHTKTVPEFMMSDKHLKSLIRGLMDADGSVHIAKSGHRGKRLVLSFSSNSRYLIEQVQQAVLAFGFGAGSVGVDKRTENYLLQWSTKQALPLLNFLEIEHDFEEDVRSGGRSPALGYQVKSVVPCEGDYVYDVTVPGSHTFTPNGVVTSNTVPKHTKWAKALRSCFVAPPGFKCFECVAEGELIDSGDGLYPIEAMPNQTLTHTSSIRPILKSRSQSKPVFKVRTVDGAHVRVTDKHPFLVARDGYLQWVVTTDLQPGDHLVQLDKEPDSYFGWDDEAYWAGQILGDGHYSKPSSMYPSSRLERMVSAGGYYRLNFAFGLDEAELRPLADQFFGVIGASRGRGDVSYGGKELYLHWRRRVPKESGASIRTPEWVLSGSDAVRASFLAGLIDSDGSYHSRRMTYCSKSEVMVRQVHVIGKSLGVHGVIRYLEKNDVWHWDVFERESLSRLPEGLLARKRIRKHSFDDKSYTQCRTSKVPFGLVNRIKVPGLQRTGAGNRLFSNGRRKGTVTREAIRLAAAHSGDQELLGLLEYRYLPFDSVVSDGEATVWDIEVAEDHSFITGGFLVHNCDFSQGELRIAACVANEPTMIKYYLQGMDLHLVAACNAMGISIDEVLAIKGTDNVILDSHGIPQTFKSIRQNGKAANFGLCIAEGQLVLTHVGLIPIEDVLCWHKVWDGVEWVSHEGVSFNGYQEVMTYDGVTATPDHTVWTEAGHAISIGEAASKVHRLARTGCGIKPLRFGDTDGYAGYGPEGQGLPQGGGAMLPVQHPTAVLPRQPTDGQDSNVFLSEGSEIPRSPSIHFGGAIRRYGSAVQSGYTRIIRSLQRAGHQGAVSFSGGVHSLGTRELAGVGLQESGLRPEGQRWSLCQGQPSASHSVSQSKKSVRVYDLVNAGPRHRFTVEGRLVHNCYGMSADGYQIYAEDSYGVKLTSAQCHAQRNAFFQLYSRLGPWHDEYKALARQQGFIRSPLGRVRHLPLIRHPSGEIRSKEERRSINAPVQSTLSDLTQYSLVKFQELYGFGRDNPEVQFAMMTHDSLSGYVREDKAEEWLSRLVEVMSNLPLEQEFGWRPQVPFVAEAELGDDMADLKEIIV